MPEHTERLYHPLAKSCRPVKCGACCKRTVPYNRFSDSIVDTDARLPGGGVKAALQRCAGMIDSPYGKRYWGKKH